MAKPRRALTDQEREQRRAEQRELVRASVEQLRSSDGWRSYLKARARFRSYSWRNVLLIYSQHPSAERVAGFRAWLDLGYCPVKGSKAIRIWARCAPSQRRLQAWRDAGADPDDKPRATYKLVSVFAQDQVGELPPPAIPAPLQAPIAPVGGDSHENLMASVIGVAAQIGYTVQVGDTGRADGICNTQTHRIEIAERLQANGRLVALIHELAHALVAIDTDPPSLDYAQGELVAESVAWCCADTVGLDTSANSIPYLASWSEKASLEVLEQTAAMTSRLAARIEVALLAEASAPEPGDQQLVDAAQAVPI